MENTLVLLIPGRPIPAVRTTQKQKYVDSRYTRYSNFKELIGFLTLHEMQKQKFNFVNYGTKVSVNACVFLADMRRVDIDNILKSFFDSLTKVVWHDDSQIVEAYIKKDFIHNKNCQRSEIIIKAHR